MAQQKDKRPVVVIRKKKVVGGGHHGGSWKVAYADFVTAMMAFFLVMWIVGMDDQTKQAIEGYFSNPVGYKKGYSAGASPLSSGNSPATVRKPPLRLVIRAYEQKVFAQVSQRLESRLDSAQAALGFSTHVEVALTEQGLRIELIEGGRGDTFFALGSARMTATASTALEIIASELRDLGNAIVIEGHTDAVSYGASANYTNWELSADRANAARRVLERGGIARERIAAVRGLADRKLRNRDDPHDPANRRISILLPFTEQPADPLEELQKLGESTSEVSGV
ncbi:MAG TPA: flagellar motor protein MotB [Gemmatimonadaceae bacterium]|nr:flagellar motor protein MotB [Gemmatimonadaceae bacterium]